MKSYSFEVSKLDKRAKSGSRFVEKFDMMFESKKMADDYAKALVIGEPKLLVEVFETYVTKTNLMSGEEFEERYDRPYYCSPSSETYWSM